MRMLRRNRQVAVDGRGERMHQVRPARVPQPQCATTKAAEMPAPFADARSAVRIGQPRPIDAEMFTPIDLERAIVATQIDGEAAATCRLAADRAIAAHERIGLCGFEREPHGLTVTGTFELHRDHLRSVPKGLNAVSCSVPLPIVGPAQPDRWAMIDYLAAASATSASCAAG